jgi:hypothetical protein
MKIQPMISEARSNSARFFEAVEACVGDVRAIKAGKLAKFTEAEFAALDITRAEFVAWVNFVEALDAALNNVAALAQGDHFETIVRFKG